jgi:hypothetical protein
MSQLEELLASSPPRHRRAVASELGLKPGAVPSDIATALHDRDRLAAVVGGLSKSARVMAARAAFNGEPNVHSCWSGRPDPTAAELERRGLAFAFRADYYHRYHVPHDLHAPLAEVLAAPYQRDLVRAEPAQWIESSVQLAHDLAAVWAYLARSAVRVKADGPVYQRDMPKLLGVLPTFELHRGDGPIATTRLLFVLDVLLDEELIELRVNNVPGSDGRRELVACGDPFRLLEREPAELRARLLSHACVAPLAAAAGALVTQLDPKVPVAITSFGSALRRLCEDLRLAYDLRGDQDFSVGMAGLHFVWLAGGVAIGLDRAGVPDAVRAVPAPALEPGRIVCQANFELVALGPPSPAQRQVLALTCDRVPDQDHVFRLTRASVRAGERSGILEDGAVAALERIAGDLPQNVKRSLVDWVSSVRRPLKLCTAMLLDTGSAEVADALLASAAAGHIVARVGPSHLAIRGSAVRPLRDALRALGHDLDPGLERISGRWSERDPTPSAAEDVWTARSRYAAPDGEQCSTLEDSQVAPPPPAAPAEQAPLPSFDEDPIDVMLDAIEDGSDVFIVYAAAEGTTQHQITPRTIEGAAVRAYCHTRRNERTFWLASIRDAQLV